MTSPHARVVPWHAVVQFHREVALRARRRFFALPVTEAASEHWSSLTGFEPQNLSGPWEVDSEAFGDRQASGATFVGGPCWYRQRSSGEGHTQFDWIPLLYREVTVEERDGRRHLVPLQSDWEICPLVTQFVEQRETRIDPPLDKQLPDLLSAAQANATDTGSDLTAALIDAIRSAVPDVGELLDRARDALPVDQMEFQPSPWVLFTTSADSSLVSRQLCNDYDRLDHHLAAAQHDVGGLRLLEDTSGALSQTAPKVVPILPLDDIQRATVETVLEKRPVMIINAPPDCGKDDVVLSTLLNAWANGTSVLYTSEDSEALDAVLKRLNTFDDELAIAVGIYGTHTAKIGEAIERTVAVVEAHRGESFFGGSPTARKQGQLIKKKQVLRDLLDTQMPQRLVHAMRAALKSHGAHRKALSALETRREEVASRLRDVGVTEDPDTVGEQILEPLRKWRSGVDGTRRLIEEDAQRVEALEHELSDVRAQRDSVLADYQAEIASDQDPSWLLAEPGFESFDKAFSALSDKLRDPIEEDLTDSSWKKAYDDWSSSEAAAEWERKARETAAVMRPASIALKEKTEEIQAARAALESTERAMQTATKASSLDARRKDLDEWAELYAELCAMPRSKLAFLQRSKHTELERQLEQVESRFRSTFPPHLWSNIGKLDDTGRERLSTVIEKAREWMGAREDWDRLIPIREEIEAETDALRERVHALGLRFETREVTPASCTAMASKLNERAALAASAAEAWAKREARERLPAELAGLAEQIRAAGRGNPIKERWISGPGAALMSAFDAVASDPGAKTINAVRKELLDSAEVEPVLESWRKAYDAEKQRVDLAEQLERIPPRAARLAHWKARRPASLPAELDATDAFDGDDTHPVWALLKACEEWSREWTAFRDEEAPSLERKIESEGASVEQHLREAAQALPQGKDRAWLESLASNARTGDRLPVEQLTERVQVWRPERLQAEIEKVDAQLERITFETAKDQWLERTARDAEGLSALQALREHYQNNGPPIEQDGYAHFERSLKVQPVWITTPTSTQSIPLQPGLFDLLIIDDASKCSLTHLLPVLFRAKCLVVIGDPEQEPAPDSIGAEAERALASRLGMESWVGLFGHVGNDAYKAGVGNLPGRKVETISLVQAD